MEPVRIGYIEKSISFLAREGITKEGISTLVDKQVTSVQEQVAKIIKKDPLAAESCGLDEIEPTFFPNLCHTILTTKLQNNLPEFTEKRVTWTDLKDFHPFKASTKVQEEDTDIVSRVVQSSGTHFSHVVVWRQTKKRSHIYSLKKVQQQTEKKDSHFGTRRLSVKELNSIKDDWEFVKASDSETRVLPRVTTDKLYSFMITFHDKSPSKPILRLVRICFTPVNEAHTFNLRLQAADRESDPKKNHLESGISSLSSYGFASYRNPQGVMERALMEVNIVTKPLRFCLKTARSLPRNQATLPIISDVLTALVADNKKIATVWRRLSLSFIKVHEEVSANGSRIFRAALGKNDFKCDHGTKAYNSPWLKLVDHVSLIDYMAPENLRKLNSTGQVDKYKVTAQEDVWALGIIFYQLLWKKEPSFFPALKAIQNHFHPKSSPKQRAPLEDTLKETEDLPKNSDNEKLGDLKKKADEDILTFYEEKKVERKVLNDPYKFIVLQMLHPDPKQRIDILTCHQKFQSLKKIYET